jgi:hypothetical protein
MTVDHQTHNENSVQGSLFQTLTLVFAGITILFAVFSIVMGNRLSVLNIHHLKTLEKSNTMETESIEQMQTTLNDTQADLAAAKRQAEEEKKKASQLNRKLSATQKELAKIKSDLDLANQTISALKTPQAEKPESTIDTAPPATVPASDVVPSGQPAIPQGKTPSDPPLSQKPHQPEVAPRAAQPATDITQEQPSSSILPEKSSPSPELTPPASAVDKNASSDGSQVVNESASSPTLQPSIQTDDQQ